MSSKKTHIELGNRIKVIRKHLKLSQKDMAKKLGIAISTYQYYERGERDTPSEVISKINTFGVNLQWLFKGKGEPFFSQSDQSDSPDISDTQLLKQIIQAVEQELKTRDMLPDPEKKAQLITLLYEKFKDQKDKGVNQEDVIKFINLIS